MATTTNTKKSSQEESQVNNNMDSKTYFRFMQSISSRIISGKLEENDGINMIMYVIIGENTKESFSRAAQWLTKFEARQFRYEAKKAQEAASKALEDSAKK